MDKFATIDQAAHSGANGHNRRPEATVRQRIAGNYLKGRETLYGLRIAIESPRGTLRHWKAEDGTSGSNLMKFHYGYIMGTLGNDGDELDCSIGPMPEATHAYVVNQFVGGKFDEHKIMFAFPDQRTAVAGYLSNYDAGWPGMDSCVACSIPQLKWWIANGNKALSLTQDQLPNEGTDEMKKVLWDSANLPLHSTLEQVLYGLRAHDSGDGLLFDAVSMADILADSDGVLTFDALVIPFARLEQRMQLLQKVLERAGDSVKVAAMQVSDPFTQCGTTNVAVIYELTDGQTVSVFFHNPDVTPKKIAPGDDLISWKWLLNKKDITVAVAPEKGRDLNVRTVAARIMMLAEKNSARFIAANGKRAEKLQVIAGLKTELETKEATLTELTQQVAAAQAARDAAGLGEPASGLLSDEENAAIDRQIAELRARIDDMTNEQIYLVSSILGISRPYDKSHEQLVTRIFANHPDDVADAIKRWEATNAAAAALNVDGIKAVVTSADPMPGVSRGSNWIVMNAPRPLLGTETMSNGEFLSGRFYAAIDPADSMAAAYVAENVKLDASMVFVADKATQIEMALNTVDAEYIPAYMGMDEEERASAMDSRVSELNGKTYGELKELAAKGMPVVATPEVTPEPEAAAIPAAAPEAIAGEPSGNPLGMTDAEMVVLIALQSYAANKRVANVMRDSGISKAQYDAAFKSLNINGGLIRMGAITPDGTAIVRAFLPGMLANEKLKSFMGKFSAPEVAPEPDAAPAVAESVPAAPEFTLEAESADDARARIAQEEAAAAAEKAAAAAAEKAARDEQEQKEIDARQAASAENFQLGQDPVDSLTGQQSVFDVPASAPAAAAEPDPRTDAAAKLQAVIDGTANLADAGLPTELGAIHAAYKDDADMLALFKQAVKAYSAYAVAKANAALSK